MPEIAAATTEDVQAAFNAAIATRCAIAFAAGCRLAVTTISEQSPMRLGGLGPGYTPDGQVVLRWEFIVLSPGESPPKGYRWTIYEQRSDGRLVGRSA